MKFTKLLDFVGFCFYICPTFSLPSSQFSI